MHAWDLPDQPLHDAPGLHAFLEEMRSQAKRHRLDVDVVDAHINGTAFADHALTIFDAWVKDGKVKPK